MFSQLVKLQIRTGAHSLRCNSASTRFMTSRFRCYYQRDGIASKILFRTSQARQYHPNGIPVSDLFMRSYKFIYAVLFNGLAIVVFLGLVPRGIAIYSGSVIDPSPSEWKFSWKNIYSICVYSEENDSPVDKILAEYKRLLVLIFKSEGFLVTKENVLDFKPPPFDNKSEEFREALAKIYAKIGAKLILLGENDQADVIIHKGFEVYNGFGRGTAASYRSLAEIASAKEDTSQAELYLKSAVIASYDPAVLKLREIKTIADGLNSVNDLLVIPLRSNPTTEQVNAITDLGLFYFKTKQYAPALKAFVSCCRVFYQNEGLTHNDKIYKELRPELSTGSALKYYTSRALWGLGLQEEAIEWARLAYDDALINVLYDNESAKSAKICLQSIATMNENLGRDKEAKLANEEAKRIQPVPKNHRSLLSGYSL
ncbi:hypothetical protein V1514DRAFT_332580 [Lipomyces japonicus]|uniref:uncharacterized protein n=1 Tax=Lipomyces japonicus TaxID=56871 RepID=UPI0034CF7245